MMLQWMFVAGVLYTEIFLIGVLMLPFISPSSWQKLFRSRLASYITTYSYIYFNVFIAILGLLFLDSVRETWKYTSTESSEDLRRYPEAEALNHLKLFRAQRNMYIAGFALFLWFILRRLMVLISREANLMAQCEASMRQARSATEAATRLMEEQGNQDDNKKNADVEKKEGGDVKKEDNVEKKEVGDEPTLKKDTSFIEEQLEETKNQLEETKEDLYRARVEFETMKKQAQSTNAEYDRLLEEYSKLERKVSVQQGHTDDNKKSD